MLYSIAIIFDLSKLNDCHGVEVREVFGQDS